MDPNTGGNLNIPIGTRVGHNENGPYHTPPASYDNEAFEESFTAPDNYNGFTTISLNRLVQNALSDQKSEIGRVMRGYLEKGESIPKKLIYTMLKEALENVDPTKPLLIVDRRLSIDNDKRTATGMVKSTSSTQTDAHHSEHAASGPVSGHSEPDQNSVVQMINGGLASNGPMTGLAVMEADQESVRSKVKGALFPEKEIVPPPTEEEKKSNILIRYFKKMRGGNKRPPYERPLEALQSLIASFLGIFILTVIDYFVLINTGYTLIIGSFGATAVLVYCAISSPLAQPRHVIGGHVLAALIGVSCQYFLGANLPWLAAALAVSISIAIMSLTNTVHPPAGATALIAVYSNDEIHALGFMYVLVPVLAGATILVLVALIVNNLFPSRRYPLYWI